MSIDFTINGKPYSVVPQNYPADITLNTFIREFAKLFGTKFYCLQGGCGVCTITVRKYHPVTREYQSRGANSCLLLLNMCHGWDIVTIEGLGDRSVRYHPIQERLAQFNGTQCGYCSPGFVMNMFSNLEAAGGNMSTGDIEDIFGGNLCRCTGYRPILDTMKSFATNSVVDLHEETDIEDLKICPKLGQRGERKRTVPNHALFQDSRQWYHPTSVADIFEILDAIPDRNYMLVAGNTAHGVYPRDRAIRAFINLQNVAEMQNYFVRDVLELGANVTLTDFIRILRENSNVQGFTYFNRVVRHLRLVAHVQVRNMGTIAGNLMIKHQHNEFVSDVFLILTTIGARLIIAHGPQNVQEVPVAEFLGYDMFHAVITRILIPKLDENTTYYDSYKVLPRSQNAHAYVNAGFRFTLLGSTVQTSTICFGGISPDFIQSTATSKYLIGRQLFAPETFNEAVAVLEDELHPDWVLPDPSPEYRRKVALGLFYRFIIKYSPSGSIRSEYVSAGTFLERPISNGIQNFDTRRENWPINQPVPKLEALWQTSGEAHYSNDIPHMKGELWAAFVTATQVNSSIIQIDATEALAVPGVVAFYSAKDIPGVNSFVTIGLFSIIENEELFCSDVVKYHSQPVGVILAKTNDLANYAATMVRILYERKSGSPNTIKSSLKEVLKHSPDSNEFWKDEDTLNSVDINGFATIRGYLELGSQFSLSLEAHTTVCVPRENGLIVYPSSQYLDLVQVGIAEALKIKENQIDVITRRVGGSYGAKISRSNHVAVACGLASWLSNRPIRFVLTFEASMKTSGKRYPNMSNYQASIDDHGKIQSLTNTFYVDLGCSSNESPIEDFTIPGLPNCYEKTASWTLTGNNVLTDAPSNSWLRAPGTLESVAMTETMMEHIARRLKMDPVDVRMNNIPDNSDMKQLLPEFITTTDYRARRKAVEAFNTVNRWKKRGIAISLMRFPIFYFGNIGASVVIYHHDGTVAISHGGIEIGQGINTKAAQVAAFTFGIPLEMVTVKASDVMSGANSIATGGSITSEVVCFAVQKSCNVLLARMKPIRDQLQNPEWIDVVKKSHEQNINLVAREIHKTGDMEGYDIWGLACSEVALDILTGNVQVSRVDILEDTGESLSPLIDIGQVEGAFVQGLGYWLTERLIYDRQNGENKSASTWYYKVPGAKDIPVDFRVTLNQKKPNPSGFMRSKSTGEMAICLSISALFAVRHALDSARNDTGLRNWYHLGAPTTIEEVVLAAGHSTSEFQLN